MDYAIEILSKQIEVCEMNIKGVAGMFDSNIPKQVQKNKLKDLKHAIKLLRKEADKQKHGTIDTFGQE